MPRNVLRQCLAKDRTIGEKGLSEVDYLPCFHAGPVLSDFEWRGNINLELRDQ